MLTHRLCPRGPSRPTAPLVPFVLATFALVAGMLIAPFGEAPAHAATGDLTCTAVFRIDFSPALTAANATGQASAVVSLNPCLSPNGRHADLQSATMTGRGTVTSALGIPCSLVLTIPFKFQINWSGGQHGELDATVNTNPLNGPVGFNGVVTRGPLAGDRVTALGPVAPDAGCLFNGLSSLTGLNQKIFS